MIAINEFKNNNKQNQEALKDLNDNIVNKFENCIFANLILE